MGGRTARGCGGVAASVPGRRRRRAHDGLTRPLVGAYYYLWNPENLIAGGSLRSQLVPPQRPPFGLIDSNKTQTATRDIANAHKAGINFFAVDWWPYDPGFSGRNYLAADAAMKEFLAAPDLHEMKFAMFYETWNLGFDAGHESTPVSVQAELHFDSDMLALAKDYFSNPSYLHIEGRPVVYLYLTRTLTGDVAGMMGGARTYLEQHGYADPFFVGDEVYWRVTPQIQVPNAPVFTGQPQLGADRPVRRRDGVHLVLRRPAAGQRAGGRLDRLSGDDEHRGRPALPADHLPQRDGQQGAGPPRGAARLQRPRLPADDQPSGPAAPVATG